MDYKYIEQLLERYFECETTLEEENILRTFFSQKDVPMGLWQYKALFTYEQEKEEPLGDDFDARILNLIEEDAEQSEAQPAVGRQTRTVFLFSRLKPLFKAAAIVAIVLTLGNAAQAPFDRGYEDPKDTYARYHMEQVDSVNVLTPVQAENLGDSTTVPAKESVRLVE